LKPEKAEKAEKAQNRRRNTEKAKSPPSGGLFINNYSSLISGGIP
jgi:hypothetical protein